jgi:zinc-binding alcohol dehydrogenase/oxidoreductase
LKAVVHAKEPGLAGLTYREIEESTVKDGEVRVRIKAVGLNHRDLFVLHRHKPADPPLIIGSDGAGIVEAVGQGVINVCVGDQVMINPGIGWKQKSDAPPEGFEILGLPFHGTFAEKVVVPAENVVHKPDFLNWEEAGVFSLSALTAYRALFTRGNLQSGMNVFIPGIGSGVATFLLQFAKAKGARVIVTSRSEEKRQRALEIGADQALDSNEDWKKALGEEKFDLVIESVGAATFNRSLDQLRPGGTIVTFGASAGDEVLFDLRKFFYGQYNLLGSTMGSTEEYLEMMQFIQSYNIKPIMDMTFPLEQYQLAFERIEKGKQLGKIALSLLD